MRISCWGLTHSSQNAAHSTAVNVLPTCGGGWIMTQWSRVSCALAIAAEATSRCGMRWQAGSRRSASAAGPSSRAIMYCSATGSRVVLLIVRFFVTVISGVGAALLQVLAEHRIELARALGWRWQHR